jgi:hypothetical protein
MRVIAALKKRTAHVGYISFICTLHIRALSVWTFVYMDFNITNDRMEALFC